MAKHLVTGGNGFVGSALVKKLLELDEEVHILDVVDDPHRDRRAHFHQVDILNPSDLDAAMVGINFVHHLAALVPIKKSGDLFWAVNVEGTRNVVAAAKKAQVSHLAHMSSCAVFGSVSSVDVPIKDDPDHLYPIEIYGESKQAAEKIVKAEMQKMNGLSCSIIRPRTILGKERLGIFHILFEWISEGKNVYIIGKGDNIFQFASLEDLVDASIQSCLLKEKSIFNIGVENYGTLRQALENLCRLANTGSKVKSIPQGFAIFWLSVFDKLGLSPLGPWHYLTYHKSFAFDLTTPKSKLNLKFSKSNDTLLADAYQWYIHNKNNIELKSTQKKSVHRSALRQGVLKLLKMIS